MCDRSRVLIRGCDLHVVDHGSGDPPLLLVHGYTGSDLDWVDVQPALAAKRRVVTYTHRGHAGSGHAEPYTLDELVADLDALITDLDLAPLHLLGHSMGGVVVQRFALDAHHDRLLSLILMDTVPTAPQGVVRGMLDALEGTALNEGMVAVFETMRPFFADARPEIRERVEHKITHMDPKAFVGFGREMSLMPSLVDRLGELATLPVTIIVGANDVDFVEPSQVMHDAVPGSHLAVIADAGHSPQEDRPDEWLRIVEEHLARATG